MSIESLELLEQLRFTFGRGTARRKLALLESLRDEPLVDA